ncbi:5-oxoprolinase subunit PxpB [Caldibacillus lycopersici]|uniref:5-oxoprolinase subunit PxpB n=1 Tax=Perspicuibacillus lycopersici TaxID=1325689 RepID=A0AAE3IZ60_9BACI|nr:5-oxoprolinase subunit PxpB [Perspicuibacillus lycopersici]MCU9614745.1 5-oxoprolinase subunit PxpB [Perspicuibacillus lycopersici]
MFQIYPFGDSGLSIRFGKTISSKTNQYIRSFSMLLREENTQGIVEWIPTFTSITIIYDSSILSYHELKKRMTILLKKLVQMKLPSAQLHIIPTCYEEEYAPDLSYVAKFNGLSKDEVIAIHTQPYYLIYMIGFTPGFPYLGGMSKRIATPRLSKPRMNTPAGSVGIAGEQTGIYPLASPGGWQIIGRTPLKLFDPTNEHPFLLEAGNFIKFVQVDSSDYRKLEKEVEKGTYSYIIRDY